MVVMVALLAATYAVVARTPGYQLTLLLAGATIVASVVSAGTQAIKPFVIALSLGAMLIAGYVLATPTEFAVEKFRLGQVSMLGLAIGIVLMMILIRRGVNPIPALASAIGLAGMVVVVEAIAGLQRPASEPVPVRAEWVALRASRPLAEMPWNRVPAPVAATVVDTFAHATPPVTGTDAPVLDGPLWSGTVEFDSVLGVRVPPHSVLTTRYAANPRGYFDLDDMRAATWDLGVADGNAATLTFPADSPTTLRVAISQALRGVPYWHININQQHLPLEVSTYSLEFRARAERARSAVVAVTQVGEPYDVLGLLDSMELAPQWKAFRFFFTPPRAEPDARIHFALGGNEAAVEIADVMLTNQSTGSPITPAAARVPYAVRYVFNAAGCRDGDYPETPPLPARRVLVLGDGFTMGVGVHERDTFAARLEAALAEKGIWEVINCAMPGYGSREVQAALPVLADRYHPGIVLLTLGLDADQTEWEDRQRSARPGRWEKVSEVWGRIRSTVREIRSHEYAAITPHLTAFAQTVRDRGGRLIVVVPRTSSDPSWDKLVSAATAGLSGDGVEVIDLGDAAYAGHATDSLVVDPNDTHPNESVHRAVADRLVAHFLAAPHPASVPAPTARP